MTRLEMLARLHQQGMTVTAAAAMVGNLISESGAEGCRLEKDYAADRAASKAYAQAVDSGAMSAYAYAHDAKGWGLAQWTWWSRKQGLLNHVNAMGVSIADEDAQLLYIVKELKAEYPALWQYLTTTADLYEATSKICVQYERPTINNIDERYKAAQGMLEQYQAQAPEDKPQAARYWPPRMLCKGMTGPDVSALQATLICHGYPVRQISGVFDETTDTALRRYQADNSLAVDGVAGPISWGSLVKM